MVASRAVACFAAYVVLCPVSHESWCKAVVVYSGRIDTFCPQRLPWFLRFIGYVLQVSRGMAVSAVIGFGLVPVIVVPDLIVHVELGLTRTSRSSAVYGTVGKYVAVVIYVPYLPVTSDGKADVRPVTGSLWIWRCRIPFGHGIISCYQFVCMGCVPPLRILTCMACA